MSNPNPTVDTQVAVLVSEFKGFAVEFIRHTTQDMAQFTKLDEKLDLMNQKLNELLIREATRTAEIRMSQKNNDKRSGIISTVVSGVVTLVVTYVLIKLGVSV